MAVAMTVIALVIIVYYTTSTILLSGFAYLEDQLLRQDVARAQDAITADLSGMDNSVGDWSNWDDAYAFAEDGNPDFIRTNLTDDALVQLRINLISFVNAQGKPIYTKAFQQEIKQEVDAPAGWLDLLTPGSPLLRNQASGALTGIVLLPQGPVLVAAHPILTSAATGPSHGTIIFGRFLDKAELARLATTTHLSLQAYPVEAANLPADFVTARPALADKGAIEVTPLNDKTVAGYSILQDIYDKPTVFLRVDEPRVIYTEGQRSTTSLLLSLVVLGVVLGTSAEVLLDRLTRSQSARQESEERYRILAETAQDLIFIVDRHGIVLYVNSFGARLFGRKPEEVMGKPALQVLGTYMGEGAARLRQIFETRAMAHWEELVQLPGGECWLDTSLVPIRDSTGAVTAGLGIARDVTNRKLTEDALRESEERFRLVVESAREAIISGDGEGKIAAWNPAAEMMYGYRKEEVIGKKLSMLIPPAFRGVIDEYIRTPSWSREVIMDGATFEIRGLRSDNSEFLTEFSITTRDAMKGRFFTAIVRDVTQRKRTEAAEREERTLAEALRDTAAALSATLNPDEVLDRILDNVGRVQPHDTAAVMLIEDGMGRFVRWRDPGERGFGEWVSQVEHPVSEMAGLSKMLSAPAPLVLADTMNYQGWTDQSNMPWIRSMLSVPIRIKGQVIGVLNLYSARPGFFTAEHARRLQTFADQAGQAIGNARALEETERNAQQLSLLYDVGLALNSVHDPQAQLQFLVEMAMKSVHADRAAFFKRVSDATFRLETGAGYADEVIKNLRDRVFEAGQASGLVGLVAGTRAPLYVADVTADGRWISIDEAVRSVVYVPVEHDHHLMGILSVSSTTPNAFHGGYERLLQLFANEAAIALENAELSRSLQASSVHLVDAYDATIQGWSRALELRERETEGHALRVSEMTVRLAQAMGVEEESLVQIRRGALLHDIGMMGIPDQILYKPGPLTDQETQALRQHPVYACEMLASIAYLRPALDIPYCHHERWDGTGYPRGLKGEEIPLGARIFAVVDVWDALRASRTYRQAWSEDQARDYVREQRGVQFDPAVVDIFLKLMAPAGG
ncbi:MAG: PAS domain S-box protein [Anaerolineae bacterium]